MPKSFSISSRLRNSSEKIGGISPCRSFDGRTANFRLAIMNSRCTSSTFSVTLVRAGDSRPRRRLEHHLELVFDDPEYEIRIVSLLEALIEAPNFFYHRGAIHRRLKVRTANSLCGAAAAGANIEPSKVLNMRMRPYSTSIVGSSTSKARWRSIRPG